MADDPLFPDFKAVEEHLNAEIEELMDVNHEVMQSIRRRVVALQRFRDQFNEIMDDIIETEVLGMKMLADLAGDMIMDEFGIEQVQHEEDDQVEDGEEE